MKFTNIVFIALGFIFTGLGIIGVLVPVLPTTPFLIVASIFFAKGSSRFDSWFRSTKLYKNYAEDFIRDRSMTLRRKAKLMALSDLMLIFPLIRVDNRFVKLFIILLIIIKYYYFMFKIKTKRE